MGWLVYVPDRGMLIGQREKLGLSQEEVAAKAGIKLEQYQKYESHDGREFSSSSFRIVNAVLTTLELDPTAFANGEYAFGRCPKMTRSISLSRKYRGRKWLSCLIRLKGKKKIF